MGARLRACYTHLSMARTGERERERERERTRECIGSRARLRENSQISAQPQQSITNVIVIVIDNQQVT